MRGPTRGNERRLEGALDSLKGRIPLTLGEQIVQHIIHADEGDPAAKNALGLKWPSKAAAHGHSIARHRVDALLPG
ncbi:hypothetical protein [Acidithiobacillus ferridurans]|uniref:hypothetical protein n=1 Tax=Acidithiobacillus ferridurans TaxID=1232575 RepID=UPI001D01F0AE|nr:hypothetical protein [Acidithiobacillus ferridurans]